MERLEEVIFTDETLRQMPYLGLIRLLMVMFHSRTYKTEHVDMILEVLMSQSDQTQLSVKLRALLYLGGIGYIPEEYLVSILQEFNHEFER